MLFSERDIAALRLLCWCQYVQPERLLRVITKTELQNLAGLGLLKIHEKSGALVLTSKGFSFLRTALHSDLPVLAQSYHRAAIQRRLRQSGLVLTAYHGGVHVFKSHRKSCSSPHLCFSPRLPEDTAQIPGGMSELLPSPIWAICSALCTMSVLVLASWPWRMN